MAGMTGYAGVLCNYLMKGNASSCCGRLPGWHGSCASQYVQKLVLPVSFTVFAAAVLRLVASSVWCHPDLQKSGTLILLIHLLCDTPHISHRSSHIGSRQDGIPVLITGGACSGM